MDSKDNDSALGIVSMECYFPKLFISQSEYEQYTSVSSGKYTIGLGQDSMSFTSDREDICSISLTVLSNLLTKNNISYTDIGWICVATETIIDHSKSISSSLQQIFAAHGNTAIEGIDVKHACYGGTFGLFTAFDRINSKYWDGKYCIVICADIAEYSAGPARCTGGAGAVALLLGRGACMDLNLDRSTYKANEYDFYKPYLNSCYPMVDGHVSNSCYLNAFDSCYDAYLKRKCDKYGEWRPCNMDNYWCFHAPYNKLVRKTFGRVIYHDFLNNPGFYYKKYASDEKMMVFLKKYETIPYSETVNVREVIKTFEKISKEYYKGYVSQTAVIPTQIGNCYTASIFMGLMSLIYECRNDINGLLLGKDIQMFSYGSGTIASLYSLKILNGKRSQKLFEKIIENNDIGHRMGQRSKMGCEVYTQMMDEGERLVNGNLERKNAFEPVFDVSEKHFYANTYYLTKIDESKQRFYDVFTEENKQESVSGNEVSESVKYKKEEESVLRSGNGNKSFVSLLGQQMTASTSLLLDKMKDTNGISKRGAIKIDKMLNATTQEITTKCSNS